MKYPTAIAFLDRRVMRPNFYDCLFVPTDMIEACSYFRKRPEFQELAELPIDIPELSGGIVFAMFYVKDKKILEYMIPADIRLYSPYNEMCDALGYTPRSANPPLERKEGNPQPNIYIQKWPKL